MKKIISFAMLLCFAMVAMAQMQMPSLPLDPAVRTGKLPNGLTYFIRHNEMPKDRANFYIAQKVGSVQEEEEQRGLAHFLEHMCFNGTKTFPENGVIQFCERIGVKFGENLNAYTSTDETVYNINDVPTTDETNIDSCLLILHDWAGALLLEGDDIDKERGVIHEEWRMRNVAIMRVLNRQLENLYPNSRYGRRMPIGLMEVVDNFPYDVLRAYYKKWYHPSLQGIIIVGDVDVDQVENKIKTMFADLVEPEDAAPYELYPVPTNEQPIYIVDKDKELKTVMLEVMWKHDPVPAEYRNTPVFLQVTCLNHILASVLNARFAEKAQEPDCPFLSASCSDGSYWVSKTMDAFTLAVEPKPGMNVEAVKAAMAEIERARQHGFLSTEIKRANDELLSEVEKQYNNRDKQYNDPYCKEYIRYFLEGNAAPGIETEYQLMQMVLPQIPTEIYGQMLSEYTQSLDSNFVFFAAYPEDEAIKVDAADDFKAAITEVRNTQYEAFVDEVNDDPLIAKLPKKGAIASEAPVDFGYTCWTLKNGARVFFKQTDFNASQVLFFASSKGGISKVPTKDVKNASMLGQVMSSTGLGTFTSTELEKKLAGKQVSCNAALGELTEHLSGSATPKDLRTLFELIYLQFQAPCNDQKGYDNMMASLRTQLENAEKDPMTAFSDSIRSTIMGKNERRFTPSHLADLDGINYADVRRIYSDRFKNGGDFDFYFTGAFDIDSLREFTEQYIAPLAKQKKREQYVDHHIDLLPGMKENIFSRTMESPQATVVEVWHGSYPYTMQNDLAVDALGSILTQRYLKSIREDAGISYSVMADAQLKFGLKDEYMLQVFCPVKPAAMQQALELMKVDLEDIAANGVREEELSKVTEFNLKTYNDNQRKNAYWQSLIQAKVQWNKDVQTGHEQAIKSLSSEQVQAFAKHLLQEGNCRIVGILPTDFTE